jgi:putative FmdB family regulatory protein
VPLYEYLCEVCGARFEQTRTFAEADEATPPGPGQEKARQRPARAWGAVCPNGHRRTRRVFSAPAVVFRGSGWYSTDSRPKEPAGDR